MSAAHDQYRAHLASRHRFQVAFEWLCRSAAWGSLGLLIFFLAAIGYEAWGWVSFDFLLRPNHYLPEEAGMMGGIWGSVWLIGLSTLLSVPVGVGAAIYLEEYAKPGWMTRQIQLNIANLAGVPSVVYGILGFTVFVRCFGAFDRPQDLVLSLGFVDIPFRLPFGAVVLAGAGTLTLLSLPTVIIAAQEALRAVPASLRHASYALGATKWQTIWHQVLPASLPGILTGVILSMSRTLGETAPLAVLGVATQVTFAPGEINGVSDLVTHPSKLLRAPFDKFTAMPLQIYTWIDDPEPDIQVHVAAAGIVVLLLFLVLMNSVAIFIRSRFQQKIRW
jgi:phosphate transport system permease protein